MEELEKLFFQIDADSSGNISRKELEFAMKKMYGKALKATVIDEMMFEGDADNDGEISLSEFKMLMKACEVDKEASKRQSSSNSNNNHLTPTRRDDLT